jgi:outer membrane protein
LKKNIIVFPALLLGIAALAGAQGKAPMKVATVHAQNAILGTKDGQKAAQDLQTKFTPRRQALEKKQADITAIQSQMRTGSATLSEAAKAKLARDFDAGRTDLKRSSDDFDAEVQQEESKIMGDLGQKVMDVVIKYATENSIAMVVDVSNQQANVLWADPSVDITNEIIKRYDAAHPAGAAAPSPAPPAATPPATKKQ